ncbi:hypothetical protein OSTOST_12163 [Ostertagia ostertagi]
MGLKAPQSGPRRECINFDTTFLSPSVYHGPHRGSLGSWTTTGPTSSTETEGPSTQAVSPDNSPDTTTNSFLSTTETITGGASGELPTGPIVFPPGIPTEGLTSTGPIVFPPGIPTEGLTTITVEPSTSTITEEPSIISSTLETSLRTTTTVTSAETSETETSETTSENIPEEQVTTVATATSLETVEPTHPLPISPDASPMTVTHEAITVTGGTEIVVTITPDSHPPEEATTEEIIVVSPDSSPETLSPVTHEPSKSTTGTVATAAPTESTHTISPEEGTIEPLWPPTVLPPTWIPVGGGATLATYRTTSRPTKTTLDPYYGVACSKRGEPIWDLICELSKASIRKQP